MTKKKTGGVKHYADPRKGGAGQSITKKAPPKRTGETIERTIFGVPDGDIHRLARLDDGTLEERTVCGSWPSTTPPRAIPDGPRRTRCPTCYRHETIPKTAKKGP